MLVAVIAFGMWWWLRRQAERIDSALVRLDYRSYVSVEQSP